MNEFKWDKHTKPKEKPKRGRRPGQKPKSWVDGDLEVLKNLYLFLSDPQLSKLLGRKVKTIYNVRHKYGLLRPKVPLNDYKKMAQDIPIIILKDKKYYEEDKLKLGDVL